MKTIKLSIIALILACSFQFANAQVRVGVRIGTPPPRRVVVVRHPVYVHHGYYGRPAYYRHGYYGRPYHRVYARPYRRHW